MPREAGRGLDTGTDANVRAGSRVDKSRIRRRRGIREPSIIMENQRRRRFIEYCVNVDETAWTSKYLVSLYEGKPTSFLKLALGSG